jgi:hypothetical protein
MKVFTILDGFAGNRHNLGHRRKKRFYCFVGIFITFQRFLEVTIGDMIKEVTDSYTDVADQ